jgi:hypothetical protein
MRFTFSLVFSLLLFLAAVPATQAAPGVTLSRDHAPPTSVITVEGMGFVAAEPIKLYFNGNKIATPTADGTGRFSRSFKVPGATQPGQYNFVATAGSGTASAPFSVGTDWPQFHGTNARHTGFNPFENTVKAGNADLLAELFQVPMGVFASTGSPAFNYPHFCLIWLQRRAGCRQVGRDRAR